jgi:hypothetical protein
MVKTDGSKETAPSAALEQSCHTCSGSGEVGSEAGPMDCPDCGGSGSLPHPNVLAEWRMRDIERSRAAENSAVAGDIRWLIAELRRARTALTEVVSLAQDAGDSEIACRVRTTAGRALGLLAARPPSSTGSR